MRRKTFSIAAVNLFYNLKTFNRTLQSLLGGFTGAIIGFFLILLFTLIGCSKEGLDYTKGYATQSRFNQSTWQSQPDSNGFIEILYIQNFQNKPDAMQVKWQSGGKLIKNSFGDPCIVQGDSAELYTLKFTNNEEFYFVELGEQNSLYEIIKTKDVNNVYVYSGLKRKSDGKLFFKKTPGAEARIPYKGDLFIPHRRLDVPKTQSGEYWSVSGTYGSFRYTRVMEYLYVSEVSSNGDTLNKWEGNLEWKALVTPELHVVDAITKEQIGEKFSVGFYTMNQANDDGSSHSCVYDRGVDLVRITEVPKNP